MTEKYLDDNGYELFYEIQGKGENSLIFIHGLCGDHGVWSKNIPAFKDKYKVIAIDMFGHGSSDKRIAPKEAFESMPAIIKSLIEKEDLKNAVLICHSVAGNILLNCMEECIDIKSYVLVDCTFNATEKIVNARNRLADTMLKDPNVNAAMTRWYKSMMDSNASTKDNELIISSFKDLDGKWALDFAKATNFVRKIPKINVPILIFESDWLTKDDPNRSFAKALPKADYFHWPASNHFFFVYEADKFNKVLKEFLDKHI